MSEGLLFRPFSEVDPHEWDELVEHSEDAWLFHRSDWLAAEAILSPQRGFGVYDDGRLVAVCPLMSYGMTVFPGRLRCLASGGLFPSGPAFRAGAARDRRRAVESETFTHLRSQLDGGRFDLLVIRLPPLTTAFFGRRVNPLLAHGFVPHCLYGAPRYWGHAPLTRIMDLEGDREAWLRTASARTRTQVRAAERAGLDLETVGYAAGWRRFRALQEGTYRRTGAAVWPEPFFEKLEGLGEAFRLYFAKSPDGTDAAALWVARHGVSATYLASATDYDGEARFGAALQFRAMEEARREGCRHYQIGPYFPFMEATDKMRRIGEFKRRVGGEDWPLPEGTLVRRPLRFYSLLSAHLAVAGARRRLRGRA